MLQGLFLFNVGIRVRTLMLQGLFLFNVGIRVRTLMLQGVLFRRWSTIPQFLFLKGAIPPYKGMSPHFSTRGFSLHGFMLLVRWLSRNKVVQSYHRCVSRETFCLFNRRLVTTFYGVSIVAEQEHVRKSWMSRAKHPMLRLSQNVTTQPSYLGGIIRPISVLRFWIS